MNPRTTDVPNRVDSATDLGNAGHLLHANNASLSSLNTPSERSGLEIVYADAHLGHYHQNNVLDFDFSVAGSFNSVSAPGTPEQNENRRNSSLSSDSDAQPMVGMPPREGDSPSWIPYLRSFIGLLKTFDVSTPDRSPAYPRSIHTSSTSASNASERSNLSISRSVASFSTALNSSRTSSDHSNHDHSNDKLPLSASAKSLQRGL
ncbi:hypothetical protein FGM00_11195 [Aggregatimonas sangjinii]|uniref:Uncharacterized protein n=1 Tax=Aggregatimonas sangjinii TaxID=2583587 RepID=A0A5B7SQY4_9FLAO|nr:hypothetical protein [Aggregatimonas sangjinii]QCX00642.1 hypothetical protein FGM00_11195 [Aggregatimonas sangjinii]